MSMTPSKDYTLELEQLNLLNEGMTQKWTIPWDSLRVCKNKDYIYHVLYVQEAEQTTGLKNQKSEDLISRRPPPPRFPSESQGSRSEFLDFKLVGMVVRVTKVWTYCFAKSAREVRNIPPPPPRKPGRPPQDETQGEGGSSRCRIPPGTLNPHQKLWSQEHFGIGISL